MKMTCSSKEGEVHFKYNINEGILRLKGYISSVTFEIHLPIFFVHDVIFFRHDNFSELCQFHIFFTLAMHVFKIAGYMKSLTLATHLSVLITNHDNFFRNCFKKPI